MFNEKKLYIKIVQYSKENTFVFLWICVIFKNAYFEEHLRTVAFEKEALIFSLYDFEILPRIRYDGIFSIIFGWFFIRILFLNYFTNKYINQRIKYYKYFCFM